MALWAFGKRILGWFGKTLRTEHSAASVSRGPRTHVIILDGTMSTLDPGRKPTPAGPIAFCRRWAAGCRFIMRRACNGPIGA